MKKTLRIMSLLLALVFVLSLAPLSAFADDEPPAQPVEIENNPAGTTLPEVKQNEVMDTNYGTVTTNNGEIDTNTGNQAEITTNNGYVGTNTDSGIIMTNNGLIENNDSYVLTNAAAPEGQLVGGVILTNTGLVSTNASGALVNENYSAVSENRGTVGYNGENGSVSSNYNTVSINDGEVALNYNTVAINNGTVKNNADGGTVAINNGTVAINFEKGTVTTNNKTVTTNYGTVIENKAGATVNSNFNTVETNNGTVGTNYKTVTTNNGTIEINMRGTVTTNNDTIGKNYSTVETNTGTVNDNQGTVIYNAGGEVKGKAPLNDGWGLKVEGADDAEVTGTGVVTEGNVSFVPKEAADLTVSVKQQDGYKLNVDAGGTGFTTAAEGGSWKVSFGAVLNNLRVFLSKLAAPAGIVEDRSGLNEQYMSFICDVVKQIGQAPENGTVEIDAGAWRSFRREVFQALALRPDVTLVTTYKGENGLMRFTVPAGADVLGLLGGKAVIEFAALAALLAVTPAEADMKLTPRS